jgi:hypothetical protein
MVTNWTSHFKSRRAAYASSTFSLIKGKGNIKGPLHLIEDDNSQNHDALQDFGRRDYLIVPAFLNTTSTPASSKVAMRSGHRPAIFLIHRQPEHEKQWKLT